MRHSWKHFKWNVDLPTRNLNSLELLGVFTTAVMWQWHLLSLNVFQKSRMSNIQTDNIYLYALLKICF